MNVNSVLNKQKTIWTEINVFWTIQLIRNISMDDEQYFLRNFIWKSTRNYMNNFVIPSKTKKELKERTIWFLKVAKKYNLCFKWSKCDSNAEEIHILKTPTKIKEIESILGFTNFYRCLIKNFSYIVKPLN